MQLVSNSSTISLYLQVSFWTVPDCGLLHPFPSLPIPQAINVLTLNSDYADQVWIWDSEDGSSFYFDVGEIVRLRVEMEEWHDQIPNAPDLGDGSASERKPPYSIIVGVSCLPFLSFWRF